jgi:hypothetical protein
MKFSAITVPVFLCVVLLAAGSFREKLQTKPRLLVFSRTEAFHHTSIPAGNAALLKLGKEHGFEVDTTTDNTAFREENLKQYAAVVFLSTTGNVLNSEQENAFERYIQAGGGFVGIHAATDTEYDWGWYGRLVGAYFESHPKTQDATLRVLNTSHRQRRPCRQNGGVMMNGTISRS